MDRVAAANYVTVGGKRKYAEKNLGTNTPGTSFGEQWFNGVQETLILPVEAFGLAPSHADDTQSLAVLRMASANNQRSVTADTTLVAADSGMLTVSAAGGNVAVTLPGANAANGKPLTLIVARTDTTANTVTISRAGADVIWPFAQTSVPLPPLAVMILRSDGAGTWYMLVAPARRRLTANLTIYVATTGSDTNSGMSAGNPLATLNAAWSMIIRTLDLNGFTVTVSCADGTYGPLVAAGVALGALDETSIQFVGNTGTPANCLITATNASAVTGTNGAQFTVNGFQLSATGTAAGQGAGVYAASAGTRIRTGAAMRFAACSVAHMQALAAGQVVPLAGYTISGAAPAAWSAGSNGVISHLTTGTITISGTPAFSTAFASAQVGGVITCGGLTFSGSATGSRYIAASNGVIDTNGGGATYLPGNAAGSEPTGGRYV